MKIIRRFSERLALVALRIALPEWFREIQGKPAGFLLLPLEYEDQDVILGKATQIELDAQGSI